jgi:hypothetical protein
VVLVREKGSQGMISFIQLPGFHGKAWNCKEIPNASFSKNDGVMIGGQSKGFGSSFL